MDLKKLRGTVETIECLLEADALALLSWAERALRCFKAWGSEFQGYNIPCGDHCEDGCDFCDEKLQVKDVVEQLIKEAEGER